MKIVPFTVKNDVQGIAWEEVNALLNGAGLTDHDVDQTRFVFDHSQVVVFILDEGKVIGCGRALTDFIAQAAIYNVAVAPQFRRCGLGEFIVSRLVRSVEHCNVILYTHPDTVGWYCRLGFELMKTGMVKYQSDSAAQMRAMGFI